MIRWFTCFALFWGGASLGTLSATEVQDLASRAHFYSQANQLQLVCRLTIEDGTGDQKVRDLKVTTLRRGGEEWFLTQITAPGSLRNLKFLRVKTKDGVGAWLKTSRGVQRLSPDGDPEPLFGSDFTTADFQPGSRDWTLGSETEETLVLERPTDPRLGWVKQVMTLRKADLLILKSEFWGGGGALVRRYEVGALSPEGHPLTVVLEDVRNKRRSRLVVLEALDNQEILPSLFSPGNL